MRTFPERKRRFFSLRHERSPFVRAVLTTLLAQVSVTAFSVLTNSVLARSLGPVGKGGFALIALVTNLTALMVEGGLGVANAYFVGSRRMHVRESSAVSLAAGLVTSTAGVLLVGGLAVSGVLSRLLPGVPLRLVMLGIVALPLIVIGDYLAGIVQGQHRIQELNLLVAVRGFVVAAATTALLLASPIGLAGAVVAMVLGAAVYVVGLVVLIHKDGGTCLPSWNTAVVKQLFSFGLRAHVGNLLQFFNYRFDMFLVNYFLGPAGVGIYTIAVALVEVLWYLPNAVGFVIFPKAAAAPPEAMNAFTPRVFKATLGITTIGALALGVAGRPMIVALFSSSFLPAYEPMLLLLPGVVLLGGAKVLTNELAGRGYPHYNSITAALALVVTVAGDFLLIPRYGVAGAAIASSMAYASVWVAAVGFHRMVSRDVGLRSALSTLLRRG